MPNLQILDYAKRDGFTNRSIKYSNRSCSTSEKNGDIIPIEWASKNLTSTEPRYGITEKEMWVICWGMEGFSYESREKKFSLETDHKALERIREKSGFKNNRVNRYIEKIMGFGFRYHIGVLIRCELRMILIGW
jgi:hypothetical protein